MSKKQLDMEKGIPKMNTAVTGLVYIVLERGFERKLTPCTSREGNAMRKQLFVYISRDVCAGEGEMYFLRVRTIQLAFDRQY